MRGILSSVLVAVAVISTHAVADDYTVATKVTSAVVFNSQARVTRTGTVQIKPGTHQLILKNFPAYLTGIPQIAITGDTAVVLGTVATAVQEDDPSENRPGQDLQNQIQDLDDQLRLINAERKALQARKAFFDKLLALPEAGKPQPESLKTLPAADWGAASKAIYDSLRDVVQQLVKQDQLARPLKVKREILQQQLQKVLDTPVEHTVVTVAISAKKAGSLTVTAVYDVGSMYENSNPGAFSQGQVFWTPMYNARYDSTTGMLSLEQQAQVFQKTGDVWEDIDLTLSTAQPAKGGEMTKPVPMPLEFVPDAMPVPVAKMMVAAPMEAMAGDVAVSSAAPQNTIAATPQPVQERATAFIGEYKVVGKVSINRSNDRTTVHLRTIQIPVTLSAAVNPLQALQAYVTAEMTVPEGAPLLEGPVSVYRDGARITAYAIPFLRPGEKTSMGLGPDDNIKVERATVRDKTSESGLVDVDTVVERHYRTTITNLHKKPVTVVVYDRLPVARHEDITVKLDPAVSTRGYAQNVDNKSGVLRWQFTAPAGKAQVIDFAYRVQYPKKQRVTDF